MSISKCFYKDVPAIRMENERLAVTILPDHGGKIASIFDLHLNTELLYQAPGQSYRVLTPSGDYCEAECSGFDDLFPTVDSCQFFGIAYPDHGEICRQKWHAELLENEIKLHVKCEILSCQILKQITLASNCVRIEYQLLDAPARIPWLWAAHCMIETEPGGTLELSHPDSMQMMFAENPPPILSNGDDFKAYTLDNEIRNFKFYCTNPKESQSVWYLRPNGTGIELNISGDCKYLGLWINQYGFHDCCCVGLEPSTQPQDTPGTNSLFNDNRQWVLTIRSYDESEVNGR